jgi:hypothetical protein
LPQRRRDAEENNKGKGASGLAASEGEAVSPFAIVGEGFEAVLWGFDVPLFESVIPK